MVNPGYYGMVSTFAYLIYPIVVQFPNAVFPHLWKFLVSFLGIDIVC